MKKWFGITSVIVAACCFATSLLLSAKVGSFPRRLSYEQGKVYHRMMKFWGASVALTAVGGFVLVSGVRNKIQGRLGWSCILAAPVLFLFVPDMHTVVGAKNACINNLRQIDGAKEQWALEKAVGTNVSVSLGELGAYLKDSNLKCPEGGPYVLGKTEEAPRCLVAGHSM